MTHVNREDLRRFYDSDLDDEEVDHMLEHLTSCVECERLADKIWSSLEPSLPGVSTMSGEREQIRNAALKRLHLGHLIRDYIDFFVHGIGRLFQVLLAPLEHALNDTSEPGNRRKNR